MELHIKISGWAMVVLSVIHIGFPRYFNWKQELASLSLINRQMMYVHMFFLAFIVGLMGGYCILFANVLDHEPAGVPIALGISIFWFVRLLFQLFVYSSSLWRGKVFETFIHLLFIVMWSYFTLVFFWLSIK